MIGRVRQLLARLNGTAALPADFAGTLDPDEQVLAAARGRGEPVVATHLGLWLGQRRIGWHLISRASWDGRALTFVESAEVGSAEGAVLLRDQRPQKLPLTEARQLPEVVQQRVNRSIRTRHHRELPSGGAWFVQRKVPGQDGIVLQVRPDAGSDETEVAAYAGKVAREIERRTGGTH